MNDQATQTRHVDSLSSDDAVYEVVVEVRKKTASAMANVGEPVKCSAVSTCPVRAAFAAVSSYVAAAGVK